MREKIKSGFLGKFIGRIARLIKNNPSRVIVYTLLAAICLATLLVTTNIRRQTEKIVIKQEQANQIATVWKALEKKKIDYQTLGIDVTTVKDKFSQIYNAIYSAEDYSLASNLIKEANAQLDQLYATYQIEIQQKAKTEADVKAKADAKEKLRGDLIGKISCSDSQCKVDIKLDLSTGSDTIVSIQAGENGNYTFHVTAGNYSLSAKASGYKSAIRTNVSIISQKQTTVDLNLEKITVRPKEPDNPSSPPSDNPNPSPTNTPDSPPTVVPDGPMTELFDLINGYRQDNGLPKLTFDSLLNSAAAGHSKWMESTGNFSHTGENGSSPWDRCSAAGTNCSDEILFQGSSGPSGALDSWKNSPPHNAVMLGNNFSAMGIGIAGNYYTVDFR